MTAILLTHSLLETLDETGAQAVIPSLAYLAQSSGITELRVTWEHGIAGRHDMTCDSTPLVVTWTAEGVRDLDTVLIGRAERADRHYVGAAHAILDVALAAVRLNRSRGQPISFDPAPFGGRQQALDGIREWLRWVAHGEWPVLLHRSGHEHPTPAASCGCHPEELTIHVD